MENNNFKWYILHVQASCEKRVIDALHEKINATQMNALFGDILAPTREIIEVKSGKRVKSEKKIFPGYIVIQMVMNDDTYGLVRSIPKILEFLGTKANPRDKIMSKPIPITQEEANALLKQIEEGGVVQDITFDAGQEVKVIDGPFASFNGVIAEADNVKMRLKVTILVFGRETTVDLDFTQVEKI